MILVSCVTSPAKPGPVQGIPWPILRVLPSAQVALPAASELCAVFCSHHAVMALSGALTSGWSPRSFAAVGNETARTLSLLVGRPVETAAAPGLAPLLSRLQGHSPNGVVVFGTGGGVGPRVVAGRAGCTFISVYQLRRIPGIPAHLLPLLEDTARSPVCVAAASNAMVAAAQAALRRHFSLGPLAPLPRGLSVRRVPGGGALVRGDCP